MSKNEHIEETHAGIKEDVEKRLRRSLSVPSPVVLCFFGFAFSKCANTMMGHHFALVEELHPFWGEDFYSLVSLVVFLVCALFARKIAPLYARDNVLKTAVALAIVAAALDCAAAAAGPIAQGAFLLSVLFAGVSGALFILLWAEFHSCLDPLRIVFYVSGAFLFGTMAAWILQDIDGARRLLILIACPIISAWCLRKSFSRVNPIDLPRSLWGRFEFPWKLVVVLGIYEFVYGAREYSPSFVWETYMAGAIAVALAVFLFACLFARKSDLTLLYRTPFALMLCGLAMVPIATSLNGVVSDLLVSAGYELMFLIVTLLMCDLSRQRGVSVLVLCGVQELTAVFRLMGHQTTEALGSGSSIAPFGSEFLPTLLTIAVIVASVVILSDRNPSKTWGASFFGVDAMKKIDDDDAWLRQRCNELSEAHGLSPREREVFMLLAQGKSTAQIERELVIATGTVKSHTRRIYQKFGIHTKRELVEIIGPKSGEDTAQPRS